MKADHNFAEFQSFQFSTFQQYIGWGTHNVVLRKTCELDEEFVFGQVANRVRSRVGQVKDIGAHSGKVFHRLSTALLPQPEPYHGERKIQCLNEIQVAKSPRFIAHPVTQHSRCSLVQDSELW